MFFFLIPLVLGFGFNLLSIFTTCFAKKWNNPRGALLSILLRDVLGIPVWAAGFCLAAITPSAYLLPRAPGIQITGWFLISIGGLIIVTALITIRMRSLAPSVMDALASSGLYARVRHPIHSGTILEFLGLFLVRPSVAIGAACALGVIWIFLQTMLEERDLLRRIPEYRDYRNRVPRFFPRIG